MKKILIMLFCLLSGFLNAQKKQFDKNDLINNKLPTNLFQPLLKFHEWQPNDKAFISKQLPEGLNNVILDLKTGAMSDLGTKTPTIIAQKQKSIIAKNGDLYLKTGSSESRISFDSTIIEKNPTFSPDSNYLAYTKNNNLYSYNFKTQKEQKLTNDGDKTTLNGIASWVYYEEVYGRPTAYRAFWWSPDSKTLAYGHFDESKIAMFPIYNSEGSHGFLEETRYPVAGDPNPIVKYGFINADGGQTVWADFAETGDQYLGWPKWLSDGSGLMVQWINRGNDHLKIYNVSPLNGSKTEIYEESQKSWISIDEADERLTLLEEDKEMMIISDKTGWKQLYLYGIDGKFKNEITKGKYTVTSVLGIDSKNKTVYFQARGLENSARFDFYSVGFDGKNQKRLTFGNFNHKLINLSPDFKYFTTTYSNLKTPTIMAILDTKGKMIKELGSIKTENTNDYALVLPEQIRVKSDDGKYDLPMNVTYPNNMQAGKKYPLLISIYGGPDAGTVYDNWKWDAKSQLLADEGIIQVTMDHRASGHFGKEGVATMHRNLGDWELTDYKTLVKYLIKKGNVDSTKICITGFSYGGYMTCLALTKGSDVFTHGMAGGSVTDWHLYDSIYTERFMDSPSENPEGYKNGSVLSFASQLKGKLLMVHGTMDDNVHMQNTIQLVDKFEELKKDFQLMLYPGGRHGWGGTKNTHFENLKLKFIYNNLLNKPLPNGLFSN